MAGSGGPPPSGSLPAGSLLPGGGETLWEGVLDVSQTSLAGAGDAGRPGKASCSAGVCAVSLVSALGESVTCLSGTTSRLRAARDRFQK